MTPGSSHAAIAQQCSLLAVKSLVQLFKSLEEVHHRSMKRLVYTVDNGLHCIRNVMRGDVPPSTP